MNTARKSHVGPAYQGGRPLEQTWIGREGSEDFAGLTRYRDTYQPGARRFDSGEACNFILVPMAIAALTQLLSWGVPEISATVARLTTRISAEGEALGLTAVRGDRRAPHYLGLRSAAPLPSDLLARLAHVFSGRDRAQIRICSHPPL